jgi:non-heme Fe2+,alpha-ketoglutarate-dependent halogenase
MYVVVIRSWVTRAYIDQPCVYKKPSTFSPRAEVEAKYRLSSGEIQSFHDNGILGPFDAFSQSEVQEFIRVVSLRRKLPSKNFGIVTDRDLHLELPIILEFMSSPAILERAAQLLGPNLLSWRSQLFFKPSGGQEIQWHQASTYMMEDYLQPALIPPDRNELFQLTIWVALSPATIENGCLQFVPGTHDRIRTIKFGGPRGFYHVNFRLEFDFDPLRVKHVEVNAGQFVIFSERVIHGSGPNQTDKTRYAFNYRLIPPSVRVYRNQHHHRAMHMGQEYLLENWRAVLLRGVDEHAYNRFAPISGEITRPQPSVRL